MLGSFRRCLHLHHLDRLRQHLRVRAGARFLDEGTRTLHRPICYVVHERRDQHLHRLCHHYPPYAGDQASAARKTPEISSNRHLRCRRFVSNTFLFICIWQSRGGAGAFHTSALAPSRATQSAYTQLCPTSHTPRTYVSSHALTTPSVCIVSILRLQSLVAISNSTDQSYDNPAAASWSSVETNVGIICSCLPLLRPLMTKCLPGVFSSHKRNTQSTPRIYPTIGSARSRPLPSHNGDYPLETTTKGSGDGSRGSSETTGNDIQVQTHIHVKVEGGEGGFSGWETPRSKKTDGRSSTDTLVKDPRDVV
jgi:hypothetical protein